MDSEESVEEKAIITNLMGINYVRQPNLDFNKIKETYPTASILWKREL